MTDPVYRILILEDDLQIATLVKDFLEAGGAFHVDIIDQAASLQPAMAARQYHLLLLDFQLPDASGLDVLNRLNAQGSPFPVIMLSGQGNLHTAAQTIQLGAAEYLVKGEDFFPTLPQLIKKTIRLHELRSATHQWITTVDTPSVLLENMHDAVVIWNQAGLILYWNGAASRLFGFTSAEMVGLPVQTAHLNRFKPPISPTHPDRINPIDVESEYFHPQGNVVWVSSRLMPLNSSSPHPFASCFMNVSRDITARKIMQQKLQETQRFITKILDTTPNIIYILGLDHHFTFINGHIKNIIGHTPEEICAMKASQILSLVHPDDWKIIQRNHQAYLTTADGDKIESEFRIHDRDNHWHLLYCRESIFSRDANGKPLQIIGVGEEVTEPREDETRSLQASARLMQAARMSAIGQLATGVAHQVSNPLTAILGEAQLLLHELAKDDPIRESIEIIETAGWRAQWAVQILNSFSASAPGTIGSVDLFDSIDQAINLVGGNFQSNGVQLKLELGNERPSVRGNSRQIEAFWVNLFIFLNSLIRQQNCAIRITALNICQSQIAIDVQLCGIIVSEEQILSIFNESQASSDISSSGLEFSICQEILRQNQGSIEVYKDDYHSNFRIILPRE